MDLTEELTLDFANLNDEMRARTVKIHIESYQESTFRHYL